MRRSNVLCEEQRIGYARNSLIKLVLAQRLGNMQKFYARRAAFLISLMMDYKYETEFRPWWWEQNWTEHPLGIELPKFFRKAHSEIELITGIDCRLLNEYLKQFPKRPYREREPREPKEQQIRKLKNPETFQITSYKNKEIFKQEVIGEVVFTIKGYSFFIRHDPMYGWVVSDVSEGKRIANSSRYVVAVKTSKEIMEKHIDEYVKRLSATKK